MAKSPAKSNTGMLVLVSAAVLFLAAGGIFVRQTSGDTLGDRIDSLQRKYNLFLSPTQEFRIAMDKTSAINALYVDFTTDVTTRLTNSTGITQTLNNNVNGYITGASDGTSSKAQMRISSDLAKDREIIVDVISIDKLTYIKGPATGQKWLKMTEEESKKEDEATLTDASLYGFNILDTLFSKNQALWKSIDPKTIEFVGQETKNNKTYKKYKVELATTKFIAALNNDPDISKKKLAEAKEILASTVMSAEFEVDTQSLYITDMTLQAKDLKQIQPEEVAKLGLSSTHDIRMHLMMSRFNLETEVQPPAESEVISADKKVLGVSTSNNKLLHSFMSLE